MCDLLKQNRKKIKEKYMLLFFFGWSFYLFVSFLFIAYLKKLFIHHVLLLLFLPQSTVLKIL